MKVKIKMFTNMGGGGSSAGILTLLLGSTFGS